MRQILFLGPPGVGKGTYARRAAPVLNLTHISAGDVLRDSVENRPEILNFLKSGKMVPQEVIFSLMKNKINEIENGGVILDGFPRNYEQAVGWFTSMPRIDLVVEFHLPDEILTKKLLGRRICSSCGELYNVFSFAQGEYSMPAMLPRRDGICDKCGGTLIQRVDDNLKIITERLENHKKSEKLLTEYLGSKCKDIIRFNVTTGIAQLDSLVDLIKTRIDR